MEQYRHDTPGHWHTSFWFLLVVIAIVVLIIAWSSARQSPGRLREAQAPAAEIAPGQAAPQDTPSDQPDGEQTERAVPI